LKDIVPISVLLITIPLILSGQDDGGKMFVYWGYNKSFFSATDIVIDSNYALASQKLGK
jgi:hypothetical protein